VDGARTTRVFPDPIQDREEVGIGPDAVPVVRFVVFEPEQDGGDGVPLLGRHAFLRAREPDNHFG
jgi:hypothetical protein